MKIVVDTNCLLASIPPKGQYYWLYQAFEDELFDWIISNEVLTEYEEKLSVYYSQRTAHLITTILLFAPNTILMEPYFRWQLVEKDPDDNKFADLAIASGADYLVTNDKDFDPLKDISFPKVTVVSLDEFRNVLRMKS